MKHVGPQDQEYKFLFERLREARTHLSSLRIMCYASHESENGLYLSRGSFPVVTILLPAKQETVLMQADIITT